MIVYIGFGLGWIFIFLAFLYMSISHRKLLKRFLELEAILRHGKTILTDTLNKSTGIIEDSDLTQIDNLSFFSAFANDSTDDCVTLIRTFLSEHDSSNLKKVAVFIIAIGSKLSAKIFSKLREDEIETITVEVSRINCVDPVEKEIILKEFRELLEGNCFSSTGGVDYACSILEESLDTLKAVDILNRLTSSLQVRPFDFIRRTDPRQILNCIQQEHPQIIALTLSYLEPAKASVILQNLPNELQSDVTRRIATMDRVSPEILREIERVLEKKLSSCDDFNYEAGGVASAVELLNLTDRSSEKQIIEALEDEDPELAEEIKKRMFVFEDIVMLDDRSIQRIVREVDSQELTKALKNVDSEVQNKIFSNFSKRAVANLKEDMEYMGPVWLKDVEEAQQKIVSIIRHLEETGEIIIARAGEDELVI